MTFWLLLNLVPQVVAAGIVAAYHGHGFLRPVILVSVLASMTVYAFIKRQRWAWWGAQILTVVLWFPANLALGTLCFMLAMSTGAAAAQEMRGTIASQLMLTLGLGVPVVTISPIVWLGCCWRRSVRERVS